MHKVALMQGDGIGPEITDAAIQVIEATGVPIEWINLPGGGRGSPKVGDRLTR